MPLLQPGGDVAGVVGSWLNTEVEVGADHGAEKLDRAFFHGVGGRAEPSGEITVEAMPGAGGVPAFVEKHGVIGCGIAEAGNGASSGSRFVSVAMPGTT